MDMDDEARTIAKNMFDQSAIDATWVTNRI